MNRGLRKSRFCKEKVILTICGGVGVLLFVLMWILPQFAKEEAGWQAINQLVEERILEEQPKPTAREEKQQGQKEAANPNVASSNTESNNPQTQPNQAAGESSEQVSAPAAEGSLKQPKQALEAEQTASAARPPAVKPEGSIDINTATEEELTSLPGIGPAKAKAILAYREQRGRFKKPEDLLEVKGIGPKMLAKMKDKLYFDS